MSEILERFALDGGVAVVTGSGRGIGEGIAIGLAQAGCDVVLTARRENEIEAVAERVRSLGCRALAIAGDITDGDFVEQLADTAKAEMGRLTLWVSNAGGADDRTPRHLADMPDRQWDYQLDLNLRAVFTGARAAARVLEWRRVPYRPRSSWSSSKRPKPISRRWRRSGAFP